MLFKYADLASDCDDLGTATAVGLKELFWFIAADAANSYSLDVKELPFNVIYNTDTIMDESTIIGDCAKSANFLSKKTVVSNHPWVDNPEEELKQIEEEQTAEDARQMELQKQTMNAYGSTGFSTV